MNRVKSVSTGGFTLATTAAVILSLAAVSGCGTRVKCNERPLVLFNEDNSNFFFSYRPDEMTTNTVISHIDRVLDRGVVTHFLMCPGAQRFNVDLTNGDVIWGRVPTPPPPAGGWPRNAKILHEKGIDIYKLWTARCREKGVSPWISMRMNDLHAVDKTNDFQHADFWRDHHEFWRVPNDRTGIWSNRALDFARPEVRERSLRIVRELMERYDIDGFELDWMRFPYHVSGTNLADRCGYLTDFMRRARAHAEEVGKARGRRIGLAVRVPTHPVSSKNSGEDVAGWVREGLVDMVVVSPFFTSAEYDIPLSEWRAWLGESGRKVKLLPGSECGLNTIPPAHHARCDMDAAAYRGWIDVMRSRGADGIYFFNLFCGPDEVMDETLATAFDPARSGNLPHRYPQSFRDVAIGVPDGKQKPVSLCTGGTITLYFGDFAKTHQGDFFVDLTFNLPQDEPPAVSVNGIAATAHRPYPVPEGYRHAPQGFRVRYTVDAKAARSGANAIVISKGGNDAHVVWCEAWLN